MEDNEERNMSEASEVIEIDHAITEQISGADANDVAGRLLGYRRTLGTTASGQKVYENDWTLNAWTVDKNGNKDKLQRTGNMFSGYEFHRGNESWKDRYAW